MSKADKAPTKVFGITIGGGKKKGKGDNAPLLGAADKANHEYTPLIPKINVIPTSVFEKYQVKGIVRKLIFTAVAIALVLGVAWAGGKYFISQEQNKIDAISAELSQISAESTALTPYQAYELAVDAKRKGLNGITESDVNMGSIYSVILASASLHTIQLSDIVITQYDDPNAPKSGCIDPDPFSTDVSSEIIIGCITIKGHTLSKDTTNGFLTSMEQYGGVEGNLYRHPFISSFSATGQTEGLPHSFEGSLSFTSALYTNKYINLSIPLAEAIAKGNVDVTDSDKSDEQEEPIEVELPDPGPLGIHALTIIPELSAINVRGLDSMAFAACNTDEFNLNNITLALTLMVEENHPEVNVQSVVAQIVEFIQPNCQAILDAERSTN